MNKLLALCLLCLSVPALAANPSVNMTWNAVTTDVLGNPLSVAGYTVWKSTHDFQSSTVWESTTTAASDPAVTRTNVTTNSTSSAVTPNKWYYFRVTAFDGTGTQSGFNIDANNNDAEVSVMVAVPPAPPSGLTFR